MNTLMKTFLTTYVVLGFSVTVWAQPQAPSALNASSATKAVVALAWTSTDSSAAAFRVERRLLGDTIWSTVGSPNTKTYSDTSIDAMTTYVYRIRATDAAFNFSNPSNEITIGPPPVGVSMISPYRADLNLYDESQFGVRPLMTLDSNGDPAVVYSVISPNNPDGADTSADNFLEFVGWERRSYAWKKPVRIGLLGNGTPSGGGSNNYSFARDSSNNTWGVATLFNGPDSSFTELRTYSSTDNGATWKPTQAYVDNTYGLSNPSLALGGGNVYLSFFQSYNGIRYLTGKLSDVPDKWTLALAPLPSGADDYRAENHLSLDSAGKPGIAFWTIQGSYNSILAFWRPTDAASTVVIDSNQVQNDFVETKLAFFGTQARVMAQVVRDDQGPSGYDRYFWVAAQTGSGFAAPAGLPSDGNTALGYGSLALGSNGQAAVVSAAVGGNSGGVQCGNPKITRSANLVNWTTCSPFPMANEPYTHSDWPQAAFAANDGLYIAMYNGDDQKVSLWGVILWRER